MEKKRSQEIIFITILTVLIGVFELYLSTMVVLHSHSWNEARRALWLSGYTHDGVVLLLGSYLLGTLHRWGRYFLIFIYPVVTIRMMMEYFHLKSVQNFLAMEGHFSNAQRSLMVPNAPEHPIGIYVPSDTQILRVGIISVVFFLLSAVVLYFLFLPKVKEQFK